MIRGKLQNSFTKNVFEVVRNIPKGKLLTYKEVAIKAGSPRAYRSVGTIVSKNFNSKIPCHRVVRSDLPAPRTGTFSVYAVLCDNGALYIGQTKNLQKRWRQHCNGVASEYTKRYRAKKLIHYEIYKSRERAVQREKWLKTGYGRKWLKREWKEGRTRQAGGTLGEYNRGRERKEELLKKEGAI